MLRNHQIPIPTSAAPIKAPTRLDCSDTRSMVTAITIKMMGPFFEGTIVWDLTDVTPDIANVSLSFTNRVFVTSTPAPSKNVCSADRGAWADETAVVVTFVLIACPQLLQKEESEGISAPHLPQNDMQTSCCD